MTTAKVQTEHTHHHRSNSNSNSSSSSHTNRNKRGAVRADKRERGWTKNYENIEEEETS